MSTTLGLEVMRSIATVTLSVTCQLALVVGCQRASERLCRSPLSCLQEMAALEGLSSLRFWRRLSGLRRRRSLARWHPTTNANWHVTNSVTVTKTWPQQTPPPHAWDSANSPLTKRQQITSHKITKFGTVVQKLRQVYGGRIPF